MFFARIAIAALSLVGVLAAPLASPDSGFHHLDLARIGVKVTRDAAVPPYNTALTQLKGLKSQVADAMAGPKSEREGKFLGITSSALQVMKDYKGSFTSKVSLLGLSDSQLGDQFDKLSNMLCHVLRSAKSVRSNGVATNIDEIMDVMEAMKSSALIISPKLLLSKFDINMNRLSAIYSAVSA
ncbi:hypothetical protein BDV93DRAFT_527800 [Ceratobasidium sp. AG-I]|nr:hypothetical protein BDV93DRAFT_527800 [Ceratobasidium sp. AG-I]